MEVELGDDVGLLPFALAVPGLFPPLPHATRLSPKSVHRSSRIYRERKERACVNIETPPRPLMTRLDRCSVTEISLYKYSICSDEGTQSRSSLFLHEIGTFFFSRSRCNGGKIVL